MSSMQHYRDMAAGAADKLPWLSGQRNQALAKLEQLELPTRRLENWRYTPLEPVLDHAFKVAEREDDLLTSEDVAQLRMTPAGRACVVLLNGFFVEELSVLPSEAGVQVLDLKKLAADSSTDSDALATLNRIGTLSGQNRGLFEALNTATIDDGIIIRVAEGVVLEQPIEVLHVSYSFESEFMAQPRLAVLLEAGAKATVIEHYTHMADTLCMNNAVIEVFLEQGAHLQHPRLQNESQRSRHLSALYVQQAGDSLYQGTTLALGGKWSRTEFHVDFVASGAHCDLSGFYLSGDQQSHDMHLDIIHAVAGCTSTERFKGILHGRSKAVFDGIIVVKEDAQQTDARLSNDNLLLSRDAEIDTKPRLEIYADDVKCSHGTTVGQIDPEMLFYLRARGIPREQALNIICRGFAGEIVETVASEDFQQCAGQLLQQQLMNVVATLEDSDS